MNHFRLKSQCFKCCSLLELSRNQLDVDNCCESIFFAGRHPSFSSGRLEFFLGIILGAVEILICKRRKIPAQFSEWHKTLEVSQRLLGFSWFGGCASLAVYDHFPY